MNLKLTAAGAALALITAGAAQAAPARSTALPSQPVPYTMLDAYLKASPKARASSAPNRRADMNSGRALPSPMRATT